MSKLVSENEYIYKQWQSYINNEEIDATDMKNVVLESWNRSKIYGINPLSKTPTTHLAVNEIRERQEKNKYIIDIARPFMHKIYDIVGNTDFILRLTDKDGYVIDHVGEKGFIAKYKKTYLENGYNLKEKYVGTNAIGLSLLLKKSIQIYGSEHFMRKFHHLTTSASPIKDKYNEVIAILSITGNYKGVHPHTLGLVSAAADAIQRELKLQEINQELKSTNKHFYEIMETISDGLIATDKHGNILNINASARELLNVGSRSVTNTSMSKFLKSRKMFENIFTLNNNIFEEELDLSTFNGERRKFIADVNYLKSGNNTKLILIKINDSKVIHSMVNKIVGASAIFTFDDIVGKSEKLESALNLARISANVDSTILLQGESGTGKEMFAQAIHNKSSRKEQPFVFLNCGAIPRELVSSELFGYEEGAFTGARVGGHAGKFELADGGTLFLDEIGDMPYDAQINLLRVLETRMIVRVGGSEVIPVDVRVIAATNKDLKDEVAKGNFREDLFYRLNVFPIYIPPLRERRDDIRSFASYFIESFSRKNNKKFESIDEEFFKALERYEWPGNVRELQNTMQMIVNIAESYTTLTTSNLPSHLEHKTQYEDYSPVSLLSLDDHEKTVILKTLEYTKYNLSQTASILKIGRSTLYRKLEKYEIKL